MKNNFRIFILIISTLIFTSCTEKISYSGKIFKLNNNNIYNYGTKKEILDNIGSPNYIDPIERKYFYFSEKNMSKNFFKNTIVDRTMIVFHFNPNNTIKLIEEYDLNNQNQINLVEDKTPDVIIKQGLLEKIFGGVGVQREPTSP